MRRDQMMQCMHNVDMAIQSINFEDIMKEIRSAGPEVRIDSSLVLSKYSQFMLSYANFNEMELQVVESFELTRLSDVSFWSNMLGKQDMNHGLLFETNFNIKTFRKAVDNFSVLLRRTSDDFSETIEGINPSGAIETITVSRVNVLIRENDMPDIKVSSLVNILNDIQALYNIILQVYNLPGTELIVGSIDSGSDKSLDLIGISQAVSKLTKLILEGWDRIRFHKEQKFDKSLKSMSEGIDVIDKIKESVDNDSISAEEGEKLKRSVIRSMENLINNGVYTPEAENRSLVRPSEVSFERKLMITYQDPGAPGKKSTASPQATGSGSNKSVQKPRVRSSKKPSIA